MNNFYKIAKIVFGCVFLILLYLFVLNGRYMHYNVLVYDKWKDKSFMMLDKIESTDSTLQQGNVSTLDEKPTEGDTENETNVDQYDSEE